MQRIATRIFMIASVIFGVAGIAISLLVNEGANSSEPPEWLTKVLMISVFVILPSFALSVALKFLSNNQEK